MGRQAAKMARVSAKRSRETLLTSKSRGAELCRTWLCGKGKCRLIGPTTAEEKIFAMPYVGGTECGGSGSLERTSPQCLAVACEGGSDENSTRSSGGPERPQVPARYWPLLAGPCSSDRSRGRAARDIACAKRSVSRVDRTTSCCLRWPDPFRAYSCLRTSWAGRRGGSGEHLADASRGIGAREVSGRSASRHCPCVHDVRRDRQRSGGIGRTIEQRVPNLCHHTRRDPAAAA